MNRNMVSAAKQWNQADFVSDARQQLGYSVCSILRVHTCTEVFFLLLLLLPVWEHLKLPFFQRDPVNELEFWLCHLWLIEINCWSMLVLVHSEARQSETKCMFLDCHSCPKALRSVWASDRNVLIHTVERLMDMQHTQDIVFVRWSFKLVEHAANWKELWNRIAIRFPKTPASTEYCTSGARLEQCITKQPKLTSSLSTSARKVVLRNEDHSGLRSTIMRLALCAVFMEVAMKHH